MSQYLDKSGFTYAWSKIKSYITTQLGTKADKATTLSGYGITDAYTKTEVSGSIKMSERYVILPYESQWRSITYGNGKFVVTGTFTSNAPYSTNGIDWYTSTIPSPSSSPSWTSITYGDGKFVAVNSTFTTGAAYSTDGVTWSQSSLPSSIGLNSVTYGKQMFVAVPRSSDKFVYSYNGVTWSQSPSPPSTAVWKSVAYGNGRFVAISQSSNKAAYSLDGVSWTETTLPISGSWSSVAYGDGKFVAVMFNGTEAYSTDGVTWTQTTLSSTSGWTYVTYINGKFIAVGNNSKGAYSTDGVSWTEITLPSDQSGSPVYYYCVTYGDGKFVAIGSDVYTVAYSVDGINWTNKTPTLTDIDGDDVVDDVSQILGITDVYTKLEVDNKIKSSEVTIQSSSFMIGVETQVEVDGVTATSIVIVGPHPDSQEAYTEAGIMCTSQEPGELYFSCSKKPTSDIKINIVVIN